MANASDYVCLACACSVTVRPYPSDKPGQIMWECVSTDCPNWHGTIAPSSTRPPWVLPITEVVTT